MSRPRSPSLPRHRHDRSDKYERRNRRSPSPRRRRRSRSSSPRDRRRSSYSHHRSRSPDSPPHRLKRTRRQDVSELDYGIDSTPLIFSSSTETVASIARPIAGSVSVTAVDEQEPHLNEDEPLFVDEDNEHDLEAQMAERRRRRQEILEKYQNEQQSSTLLETSSAGTDSKPFSNTSCPSPPPQTLSCSAVIGANFTPTYSVPVVPVASGEDERNENAKKQQQQEEVVEEDEYLEGENEIAAADYDPNCDLQDDERKHQEAILQKANRHPTVDSSGQVEANNHHHHQQQQSADPATGENDDQEDELDMFADDVEKFIPTQNDENGANHGAAVAAVDGWHDAEGYYQLIAGDLMANGRYRVLGSLGRGVFSSVLRARDLSSQQQSGAGGEVAVKIIRFNEMMRKAGTKEVSLLRKLHENDPEGRKHVVRMLDSFEHRGHLCIVFESMSMNLREVLKKYGNNKGINLKAVRVYAQQLFLALSLLRKCNILHADIKPDNMLVNESKTVLKLADLGSASDASENDITPYLVSRFYRAPEIILGVPYDFAIDVWSVACTLYELYTGKILFPGRTNNQMLQFMMDCKGRIPYRLLKRGQFAQQYFTNIDLGESFVQFNQLLSDGSSSRRMTPPQRPARDLKSRLLTEQERRRLGGGGGGGDVGGDDWRLLVSFVDFLDKCLVLAPDKRMTVREALAHPFITGAAALR